MAMVVHVTAPAGWTAQEVRREVRDSLRHAADVAAAINNPVVTVRRVCPVPGTLYNRKPKGTTA